MGGGYEGDYCRIESIIKTIGCPYSRKSSGAKDFYLFATFDDAKASNKDNYFICSDVISAFNTLYKKDDRWEKIKSILLKEVRSQRLKRRIRRE